MYFENLSLNKLKTKSLKKKLAIEYKISAPIEIDKTEIKVPNHFPNKIPEKSKSGEPKPSNDVHTMQNIKKIRRFK